jgi:hypothetical protein
MGPALPFTGARQEDCEDLLLVPFPEATGVEGEQPPVAALEAVLTRHAGAIPALGSSRESAARALE